jgi:chemotaxis protein MotB
MRKRSIRHLEPQGHGGNERWLVSYADFITLLFAFFTTLYAISTVDARKLQAMRTGLQAAFATAPDGHTSSVGVGDAVIRPIRRSSPFPGEVPPIVALPGFQRSLDGEVSKLPESTLEDLRARLAGRLVEDIHQDRVELRTDRRGLVISIREAGSFETGSADLSAITREMLAEIAVPLREVGNLLRIEGHTDNVPIHTERFASNWQLSTARATAVVAFFIEEMGMEAARLSAAGYSEFHPRDTNDTPSSRARNRRVDIVVLNPVTSEAEEPPAGGPGD